MSTGVTIVAYWVGASYVLGIGLAVDQLRRPLPEWELAGRNRRFWVLLTLVMGFHGLGEYAAAAYLAGVVPRFRAAGRAGSRRVLERASTAVARRWQRATGEVTVQEARRTGVEQLVVVAAVLVFVSSFIHSAVTADHFEQYWLYGVFFAVVTALQVIWAVSIYGDPRNRRLLVAGAVGNALLIVVWAITRTVGVPVGPQRGPEAVGAVDVFSKLDELGAGVLIVIVLTRLREGRSAISPLGVRMTAMLSGPLVIYSLMAAFGGAHHHH